ncbi:MAG TPA: RagB/SusD family nutrient uptake outer membrane protein [Cytophagales bacterium]|nr:RagB/SusD family nutrient uptake outer membrane protein [Cytophagales bacterium]
MKKIFGIIMITVFAALGACTDLNLSPKSATTGDVLFNDPSSYKQFLARIYSGLAVVGQGNPDADNIRDILSISDAGFSAYMRQYWGAQELSTDEAVIGWNDDGLPAFHLHTWTTINPFLNAMFSRVYFQVGMANEFLIQTTEDLLIERGIAENVQAEVKTYRAEARFLRALSYWHGLDLFGNIPIVPETNPVGTSAPGQPANGKQDVFNFIESELLAIEAELGNPRFEYGRADKAAAWMLLAKLYLNAEVYIGTPKYTEALTFINKIINAGYSLDPVYQNLFLADNHTSPEVIFSVNFDGNFTRTYGGTTFIAHAAIGGSMTATDYGLASGWAGLRTTPNLVRLFPNAASAGSSEDLRAIFYSDGQTLEIPETPTTSFNQGYAVPKFKNITSQGVAGSNATFADIDFPMFRLADAYLMYAEAVLRGGSGGDLETAVIYINALRERAYGNANGNIASDNLDLFFIIDERGRELYWEGHRRTDLIRFNLFTTNPENNPRAIWAWKGNVAEGKQTETFRNVYPIPSQAIIANPQLKQNTGY